MANRRKLTKQERLEVYRKMGGHCAYCGSVLKYEDMQVDHVKALNGWSEEGPDTLDNMLPACRSCNHYKSAMSIESFRKMVENMPTALERDSVTYRNALRFGLVAPNPHPITFYFERYQKVINTEELPDCDSCYEPTKKKSGVIYDLPPGEFTITYTCENEECKKRNDIIARLIYTREINQTR